VIGLPVNDFTCLTAITEEIAARVKANDPELRAIADAHMAGGTGALAAWLRSLPQRDDDGDPNDGPKVEACEPAQRLLVPSDAPNCVERTAIYLGVAEMLDPDPVRQMATIETPLGAHTFPVENGAPVVLDPRITRNCAQWGLAMVTPEATGVEPRAAIDWAAEMATHESGAAPVRNGASRVHKARNAIMRLVDQGVAPDAGEVDAMGWMFALAQLAARRYGPRMIRMVQTIAHAVADVLDEVLARGPRNIALEIGGMRFEPTPWMSALAGAAGHIGLDLGATALRAKLARMGIGDDLVGLVEQELNNEGLTLGVLAHPPKLSALGMIQPKAR
jgi:hypothetical protein